MSYKILILYSLFCTGLGCRCDRLQLQTGLSFEYLLLLFLNGSDFGGCQHSTHNRFIRHRNAFVDHFLEQNPALLLLDAAHILGKPVAAAKCIALYLFRGRLCYCVMRCSFFIDEQILAAGHVAFTMQNKLKMTFEFSRTKFTGTLFELSRSDGATSFKMHINRN